MLARVETIESRAKLKMFHAALVVTRTEEWCVEAETAEEARELLVSGSGHRCHIGDCLQVEVESIEDDAV